MQKVRLLRVVVPEIMMFADIYLLFRALYMKVSRIACSNLKSCRFEVQPVYFIFIPRESKSHGNFAIKPPYPSMYILCAHAQVPEKNIRANFAAFHL